MINRIGNVEEFIREACEGIVRQASGRPILCALSGGVDSAVCAMLAHKAVGDKLYCLFVDTGLMRKNEGDQVEELFSKTFGLNLIRVDAEKRFLEKLKGVTEPEKKRMIVGEEFIRVFEEEAENFSGTGCLMQGTIYPDVIESGLDGHKQVKAHHNVGGMPGKILFDTIIEPLRMLYKEDVRACGIELGLPEGFVNRQPFPGPGLSVRCVGEVTKPRLDLLREADAIFREEIENAGLEEKPRQYFALLPGVRSVGVRDGARSYEETVALRAIHTQDFVTARAARLPYELLERVTERITREVKGVNRIVYDVTGKPTATVEYE